MTRLSFSGLRPRLMLLVSLAAVPALGLILYTGLEERRQEAAAAQEDAMRLVRIAAADQERLIDATRQLLTVLAQLPAVRRGDPVACNALFVDLLRQYPAYANLGMADLEGDIFSSAAPLTQPVNTAGRAWYQRAVQTRAFVVGEYQIGRITGKPVLVCGYPVLDQTNQLKGILFAGLDVAWFNRLVAEAQLPRGATLTVIDRNGTVLARSLDPERWVGKPMSEAPIVKVILTRQKEGVAEVAGVDGVPRLYAFMPLRGMTYVPDAHVSIGIPSAIILEGAHRILIRNLTLLGLVTLLALVVAWVGSDLFLLRRMNALLGAIRRLRAGDLTARAGLPSGPGEIEQLAAAFDEMALSLEQRVAERERAEEERIRLSMAVEQAAESIVITEPDGTIVYVNPAFERVSGYSRAEAVGQSPRILKSGKHHAEFYRAMWATLTRGEVWSGHLVNRRKDGSLYEEEAVISPVRDTAGKVINYVAVKRDVTQEVTLEAQLRQAQKMEAIGTLAGGIAHDFNNMLTSIIGFAQLALLEEDLSPQARKYVSRIPEQGQQAVKLISQLLTFSRRAITERKPLQLLSLVKETVKMLERTVPENIAIRLNVPGEVAPVSADLTQMQQVLLNLCVNASQAMSKGGELTLSLENVALDEAYCRRYAYARLGHYVCLSVRDTGVGMTPEVQEHIFEPFFTTKGVEEGTGLGLATVYGIVKTHEGHINVYSEVGKGSEFKVYLPVMKGETPRQPVSVEERPVGGTETVLVVEDDVVVLTVGRSILEKWGYTVLTSTNGKEAIEVYRAHQDEIALVLTDTVMPKMGGEEFYEALRQINPAVKALLMSGYSLRQDVADLRAKGLRGFVQKPLDFHKLGLAVRKALDE